MIEVGGFEFMVGHHNGRLCVCVSHASMLLPYIYITMTIFIKQINLPSLLNLYRGGWITWIVPSF